MGIKLKDILGIVGVAKEVIPLIKGKEKDVSIKDENEKINLPTPSDPLGQGEHDQPTYVLAGIFDLSLRVNALPNSRQKSILLTKLDEMRHWARDLKEGL